MLPEDLQQKCNREGENAIRKNIVGLIVSIICIICGMLFDSFIASQNSKKATIPR